MAGEEVCAMSEFGMTRIRKYPVAYSENNGWGPEPPYKVPPSWLVDFKRDIARALVISTGVLPDDYDMLKSWADAAGLSERYEQNKDKDPSLITIPPPSARRADND